MDNDDDKNNSYGNCDKLINEGIMILIEEYIITLVDNNICYLMTGKRKTSSANEPMFKFIMVGDSATGKSSLLIRYTKN